MENTTINNEVTNNTALMAAEYKKGHKAGLVKGIAIGASGVSAVIGGIFGIKTLIDFFKDPDDPIDVSGKEVDDEVDFTEEDEENEDEGTES